MNNQNDAAPKAVEVVLAPLSTEEEIVNTITHGLGFALSVPAAIVLLRTSLAHQDVWRTVGCTAFGLSLMAVYAMSTLSHLCSSHRLRTYFRSLDQGCIYLLITATYTPFSLTYLRTPFWWAFLALMWGIAIAGFLSKVHVGHRIEGAAIWTYVVLGWMPGAAAPWLVPVIPAAPLWWMLAGGLCYTFGTLFLLLDRKIRHLHGIWHLFVIAGSACHFYAIWRYIASAD